MIYGLYSIHDACTGFLPLTYDISDSASVRNFKRACLNADSLFFTQPSDYSLYRVGSFNSETGIVEPCEHVHLVNASEFFVDRKDGE